MPRKPNIICSQCSGPAYKRPHQIAESVTGEHFCSRSCYAEFRRIYATCDMCGKKYDRVKKTQRYCSISCAASRLRKEKWNGRGKNKSQTLKNRFRERGWDGECMVLGCTYSVTHDLHRVIPGKNGGEYTLENVCIICPNHHAEISRDIIRVEWCGEYKLKSMER